MIFLFIFKQVLFYKIFLYFFLKIIYYIVMENKINRKELETLYRTKYGRGVAKFLGCTIPTAINILRKIGIEIRKRGRPAYDES